MSDDKGTLSRWSERKLAARRVGAAPVEEAPTEGVPAEEAPPHVPSGEAQAPALPPVDTLDADSDYTVFLGKNVPEALVRAALRKLWTSDPVLANLDGLNHYDEDYNVIDRAISLAQTSYHPELGFLDKGEEPVPAEALKGSAETEDHTKVKDGDDPRCQHAAELDSDDAASAEAPSPAIRTPEDQID